MTRDGRGRADGKSVLITGAASGLGRRTALRLTDEGADLILCDLNMDGLRETADIIRRPSLVQMLDVTSQDSWNDALATVAGDRGRLDGLVNCAGIAIDGDNLDTLDASAFQRVMNVNVLGTYLGCQAVLPLMRRTGGSIVNLGSMRSYVASSETLAYTTSKTAVLGLTRAAAVWCAEAGTGIRVNAVCPGAIRTEMHHAWIAQSDNPEATEQAMTASYPVGRLGEPDDVAWMIVYLISDESRFVTGSGLVVDGGYTAR